MLLQWVPLLSNLCPEEKAAAETAAEEKAAAEKATAEKAKVDKAAAEMQAQMLHVVKSY